MGSNINRVLLLLRLPLVPCVSICRKADIRKVETFEGETTLVF